jgi:hypothetical protein
LTTFLNNAPLFYSSEPSKRVLGLAVAFLTITSGYFLMVAFGFKS